MTRNRIGPLYFWHAMQLLWKECSGVPILIFGSIRGTIADLRRFSSLGSRYLAAGTC